MPRNSSGNYTLPAGNPVAPNTLIETAWANPTMADIGAELTNSLDRQGRGTMLAPLKIADGTVGAPALSFNSEASSGIYKPAAHILAIAIAGAQVAAFADTGINLKQPVLLDSDLTVAGAMTLAGDATFNGNVHAVGNLTIDGSTTLTGPITMAGVLSLPLGTAPLPSLSFTGDPNTGVYSPGADQIAWATAGVGRVGLNAAGHFLPGANEAYDIGSNALHFNSVNTPAVIYSGVAAPLRLNAANAAGTIALRVAGADRLSIASTGAVVLAKPAAGATGLTVQANPTGSGLALFADNEAGVTILYTANTNPGGLTQFIVSHSLANVNIGNARAGGSVMFYSAAALQWTMDAGGNWLGPNKNVAAANYNINDSSTTTAGTFGFTNGNGPSVQTWGVASGAPGQVRVVSQAGATVTAFDPTNGRIINYQTPYTVLTEAYRFQSDSAFINWWNSVASIRTGYIQFNATGLALYHIENAAGALEHRFLLGAGGTVVLQMFPTYNQFNNVVVLGGNYKTSRTWVGIAPASGVNQTAPNYETQVAIRAHYAANDGNITLTVNGIDILNMNNSGNGSIVMSSSATIPGGATWKVTWSGLSGLFINRLQ